MYLKVWMPDNKSLDPELFDKSLEPGGGGRGGGRRGRGKRWIRERRGPRE